MNNLIGYPEQASTILISLFNGLVLASSYYTYSQPKANTLYFK